MTVEQILPWVLLLSIVAFAGWWIFRPSARSRKTDFRVITASAVLVLMTGGFIFWQSGFLYDSGQSQGEGLRGAAVFAVIENSGDPGAWWNSSNVQLPANARVQAAAGWHINQNNPGDPMVTTGISGSDLEVWRQALSAPAFTNKNVISLAAAEEALTGNSDTTFGQTINWLSNSDSDEINEQLDSNPCGFNENFKPECLNGCSDGVCAPGWCTCLQTACGRNFVNGDPVPPPGSGGGPMPGQGRGATAGGAESFSSAGAQLKGVPISKSSSSHPGQTTFVALYSFTPNSNHPDVPDNFPFFNGGVFINSTAWQINYDAAAAGSSGAGVQGVCISPSPSQDVVPGVVMFVGAIDPCPSIQVGSSFVPKSVFLEGLVTQIGGGSSSVNVAVSFPIPGEIEPLDLQELLASGSASLHNMTFLGGGLKAIWDLWPLVISGGVIFPAMVIYHGVTGVSLLTTIAKISACVPKVAAIAGLVIASVAATAVTAYRYSQQYRKTIRETVKNLVAIAPAPRELIDCAAEDSAEACLSCVAGNLLACGRTQSDFEACVNCVADAKNVAEVCLEKGNCDDRCQEIKDGIETYSAHPDIICAETVGAPPIDDLIIGLNGLPASVDNGAWALFASGKADLMGLNSALDLAIMENTYLPPLR